MSDFNAETILDIKVRVIRHVTTVGPIALDEEAKQKQREARRKHHRLKKKNGVIIERRRPEIETFSKFLIENHALSSDDQSLYAEFLSMFRTESRVHIPVNENDICTSYENPQRNEDTHFSSIQIVEGCIVHRPLGLPNDFASLLHMVRAAPCGIQLNRLIKDATAAEIALPPFPKYLTFLTDLQAMCSRSPGNWQPAFIQERIEKVKAAGSGGRSLLESKYGQCTGLVERLATTLEEIEVSLEDLDEVCVLEPHGTPLTGPINACLEALDSIVDVPMSENLKPEQTQRTITAYVEVRKGAKRLHDAVQKQLSLIEDHASPTDRTALVAMNQLAGMVIQREGGKKRDDSMRVLDVVDICDDVTKHLQGKVTAVAIGDDTTVHVNKFSTKLLPELEAAAVVEPAYTAYLGTDEAEGLDDAGMSFWVYPMDSDTPYMEVAGPLQKLWNSITIEGKLINETIKSELVKMNKPVHMSGSIEMMDQKQLQRHRGQIKRGNKKRLMRAGIRKPT